MGLRPRQCPLFLLWHRLRRPPAENFTATDQNGEAFDFTSTRGKVTALFFGFTHCPNVCPLTLSYLQKAREALPPARRGDVRVVFVTLDPAWDTPAKLRDYVAFFGEDLTGLFVPEPRLAEVARAYGVGYAKADVKDANTYQISHTTATYLIDREGRLRLVWDDAQLPQVKRVARDLARVLSDWVVAALT